MNNQLLTDSQITHYSYNELTLDPLTLAHGGDYTCTAVYTVGGHTTTVRSRVESVVPISELSPQFITNCYCT